MTDWEEQYATPVSSDDREDYLKQVGHTLNGKSISAAHFQLLLDQAFRELDIQDKDVVLDLCCGNGYITVEFARACESVVGVDFSDPLLKVAREDHCPRNVEYLRMNVLDLDVSRLRTAGPYSKISVYAALQHFKKKDLSPLLRRLVELSTPSPTILLGFVPDRGRLSAFYNTPSRKLERIRRILTKTDVMGTWWDKEFIERVGSEFGLRCEFHDLDERLHASAYRFDVVLHG